MNKAHQASGTSGCTDSPMIPGSGFPPVPAPIDAPALPDPIVAPQQTALEGAESGEPYADASGGGSVDGW
ncbi:MAG TPA: hypothetical protein PKX10_09700 [Propioniciclava tarda]|nr:hypothetical protein [Propioniciclava tarda]HQD61305.1 hypothetical protein [Propioniciclava tarda]